MIIYSFSIQFYLSITICRYIYTYLQNNSNFTIQIQKYQLLSAKISAKIYYRYV